MGELSGAFAGRVTTDGSLAGESKFAYSYEAGVVDVLVSPFNVIRQGDRIADDAGRPPG